MNFLGGLGKSTRSKLSKLNRAFKDAPFSISEAKQILNSSSEEASRFMTALSKHGWAKRLQRGHYYLVPLEASDPNSIVEDPWFAASNLFSPCYISGWSAAEHWGFTEQIFRSIYVVTARKLKNRNPSIGGMQFILKTTQPDQIFGTKTIWKGKSKALVADPTKLIVDLLDTPESGGGINHVVQIFKSYLRSEHKSIEKLFTYAKKKNNGAIFKRLGFLTENLAPEEKDLIENCRRSLSAGYSKLDLQLPNEKIITKWKLWITYSLEKELKRD